MRKNLKNPPRPRAICRHITAAVLCGAMLLPLGGCVGKNEAFKKQMFAMDTVMTLTAYGKNGEAALNAAAGVINSLNALLDPEDADSGVYALNNAGGGKVAVSAEIGEMLETAQTIHAQTGGALDPSIYPLVKLWGFIDSEFRVPTEAEIAEGLKRLCLDRIAVQGPSEDGSYSVTMPSEAQVTFGAIAKGLTSDRAVAAMRDAGASSAIISLGGNVQTLGLKPDGSNWNVAIQDPEDTGGYVGIVSVGETAVITSGSYQRYFEQNGVRYHHIIDPATGFPADNGLVSATIICKSGMTADCLSTAMCVLGEAAALDYWRDYGGFEMILITDDERVICTGGLRDSFTLYNEAYTLTFSD